MYIYMYIYIYIFFFSSYYYYNFSHVLLIRSLTRHVNCWVHVVAPGQTFTVCENAMAELKCPDSKKVRVLSASYGRDDTTTCPYGYTGNIKCRARVTKSVSRWCAGKTKCLLVSHNSLVRKDPCPNTYKYLRVRYICQ